MQLWERRGVRNIKPIAVCGNIELWHFSACGNIKLWHFSACGNRRAVALFSLWEHKSCGTFQPVGT